MGEKVVLISTFGEKVFLSENYVLYIEKRGKIPPINAAFTLIELLQRGPAATALVLNVEEVHEDRYVVTVYVAGVIYNVYVDYEEEGKTIISIYKGTPYVAR